MTIHTNNIITKIKIKIKTKTHTVSMRHTLIHIYIMRLINSIRTWCKTYVLPLQSQHAISSYHIFKNKHNHTPSILIPIYKSNQIRNLLRCY